jgi:hypothetical protein
MTKKENEMSDIGVKLESKVKLDDSFEIYCTKELDLDEGMLILLLILDEVPSILFELVESSSIYQGREQFDKAAILL